MSVSNTFSTATSRAAPDGGVWRSRLLFPRSFPMPQRLAFTTAFVLSVVLLLPTLGAAQSRSHNRIAAGLALVGGGVVMALASKTCTLPDDPRLGYRDDPTLLRITLVEPSGGPWVWTDCTFQAEVAWPDGASRVLNEARFRTDPPEQFRPFWNELADDAISRMQGTSELRRWGGVAVAVTGVLLATVWSNSYAEPVFDVQAGPRHIRLSKSFGF